MRTLQQIEGAVRGRFFGSPNPPITFDGLRELLHETHAAGRASRDAELEALLALRGLLEGANEMHRAWNGEDAKGDGYANDVQIKAFEDALSRCNALAAAEGEEVYIPSSPAPPDAVVETLEFYAAEKSYDERHDKECGPFWSLAREDNGRLARAALSSLDEPEEEPETRLHWVSGDAHEALQAALAEKERQYEAICRAAGIVYEADYATGYPKPAELIAALEGEKKARFGDIDAAASARARIEELEGNTISDLFFDRHRDVVARKKKEADEAFDREKRLRERIEELEAELRRYTEATAPPHNRLIDPDEWQHIVNARDESLKRVMDGSDAQLADRDQRIEELEADTLAHSPEVAALIEAAVAQRQHAQRLGHSRDSQQSDTARALWDAVEPFLPAKKTRLEVECPVCGEPTRVECASCTWSRAAEAGEGE